MTKTRLAKAISQLSGISRREAEKLILAGHVTVNEDTILTPVHFVTDVDDITLDGSLLKKSKPRLYLLNKPVGFVCSSKPQNSQKSVYNLFPHNVFDRNTLRTVGRLDINSEGLLLVTTSPSLSHTLIAQPWDKVYRVRLQGSPTEQKLLSLSRLRSIEGERITPMKISLIKQTQSNTWAEFVLREGRNRQIRKALLHIRSRASRIIRTDFGPLSLNDLPSGHIREVHLSELHLPESSDV